MALQRRRAAADPTQVPTLVLAAALALAIAAGAALGAVQAGVVALALALALIAAARARGLVRGAILLAALGLVRGWGVSHELARPRVVIPHGLIAAQVRAPTIPGPRCQVPVSALGERWIVEAPPARCPLAVGDRLWIRAEDVLRADRRARLPWRRGPGDPRSASQRRVAVDHLWPAAPPGEPGWGAELRERAWALSRGSPERGLVVAATLGMPAAIGPELRAQLRQAGLGHLLAVSGLHVALAGLVILGGVMRAASALGWSRPEVALLGLAPVLAYVALSGGAPSALRATGMLFLHVLGIAVGRPGHGPTILALSAAGLLLIWPSWALDPGFQLSLAAMAVLVHPGAPRGILVQSWRITWATLPIALWHFGSGSILGVGANLLAIPLFSLWVLPSGLCGILLAPWLGEIALAPASWGAAILVDLARLVGRLPVISPAALAGLALGILALRGIREIARRRRRGGRAPRWRGRGRGAPWLALVAVVAVVALRGPTSSAALLGEASGSWLAIGGGQRVEAITRAADSGICLKDPWLSPSEHLALIEAIGGDAVVGVEDRRGDAAAAELRRGLEGAGLWSPAAARCEGAIPSEAALRRLVRRCRALAGSPVAMIRGGAGAVIECWGGAGWRPLARRGDREDARSSHQEGTP